MSQSSPTPGLPATLDAASALAALAWLVDAGVDTLVETRPVRWLDVAAPAAPDPAPILPAAVAVPQAAVPQAPAPAVDVAALTAQAAAADTLAALQALLTHATGRVPLFGDGNPAAPVMVLGDMPSADDIAAGRLFAGPSGQLLDRMLAAIGRDRADTYLANLLAWPTPGGRAPQPHEIAAQLPFVRRQIELVRPRAVLVLGGVAAAALLGVEGGINRLRGRWQTLAIGAQSIALLPSFAPAYLLAHPAHKALAWRDLLLFNASLAAPTDPS